MDLTGALVGWRHQDLGDRLMLMLETRQKPDEPDDFDTTRVLLTKQQAAVLANYLFEASGQSPPATRKRGWFRRSFG